MPCCLLATTGCSIGLFVVFSLAELRLGQLVECQTMKHNAQRLRSLVNAVFNTSSEYGAMISIRLIYASLFGLATTLTTFAHADKRVLIIGIDGAGGSYLQSANTPNIDALASEGLARFDWLNEAALAPKPPQAYGASGVNWSTINTGASAASHGVKDNSFEGNHFDQTPHWFKHLKDRDAAKFTASIVSWAPINEHIAPDESTDLKVQFGGTPSENDGLVRDTVVNLLSNGDPDAIFVQLDQVDDAGHAFSWGSPEYLASIEAVDGLIGNMINALQGQSGVRNNAEDWLVMVTADHGGAFGSTIHVASQGASNWEVPFIISGPSVLQATSLEQGTLRDIATTALWHMGVDPRNTPVEGHIVGIAVPEPGAFTQVLFVCAALALAIRYSRVKASIRCHVTSQHLAGC